MQILRFSVFLLLLLLCASFGYADSDEEPTTEENPSYQITVTADRLEEPVTEKSDAISVITRKDIEQHQWNYVVDALRQVPGVALLQTGSPGKTTSLFLRGAGSAQVLVLIDGIPLNNPYFGGVNLEDIPTDNVERIEVLKGPQSPLYGSDSIAGVVQIISRKGDGDTAIRSSFEGGSFNTFRERAGIHGNKDAVNYSLTFSRQDTEGTQANDDFHENAFSASGGYRINSSTALSANTHIFDSNIGLPFHFVFDPVTFQTTISPSPLQKQESNLWVLGTGIQHTSGEAINLDARFSFTRRKFFFEDPGLFPENENSSHVYQFKVQNDVQLTGNNTLTAGYEFEHETTEASDAFNGSYDLQDVNDHAGFVQNKFVRGPWIATAGVRFDHYNTFGNTWNPRVSVAYKLRRDWKLRASYGTGFRAPSAGDLGLPFFGNPNLNPEKSRSWETGLEKYWSNHDAAVSVSWFHNSYDDLITFDPATLIAGNVAEAKVQGLELSASWQRGGWKLASSYTLLETEDEQTGLRLPRRPNHVFALSAGYGNRQFGAAVNVVGVGDRLESDFLKTPAPNVLNPGYGRVDVAGHYRWKPWLNLKARIENVTDREYEQVLYYRAPGIGFFGGVDVEF